MHSHLYVECFRSILFITRRTTILKTSGGSPCFVVISSLIIYKIMAQQQSFKERRSFSKSYVIDYFVKFLVLLKVNRCVTFEVFDRCLSGSTDFAMTSFSLFYLVCRVCIHAYMCVRVLLGLPRYQYHYLLISYF